MKIYFPIHLDGGNRGCEGIAKGTAVILGKSKEDLVGLCRDIPLDTRLGIGDQVSLQSYRKISYLFRSIYKVYVKIKKLFHYDNFDISKVWWFYTYMPFLKQMRKEDIMISTGGDMMCYGDNEVIYTNDEAKRRGVKTILWGCSMGPENLTERKLESLKRFDLIYARDSLSFDFFKSLGLTNVICYPDPAFFLTPEKTEIPYCFTKSRVVGINLSNYTIGAFDLNTPFGNQVRQLLDYIITKTDYQILLIPHVTWGGQDDRILARNVLKEYDEKVHGRISILSIDDLNYLQIRYVISNCYLFIGGRTHAVISAYSTCVPTIALGYSIKSKGIAKDLGLDEKLVVNSKNPKGGNELMDSFMFLQNNVERIKTQLRNAMTEFNTKSFEVKRNIKLLIN